MNMITRNSKKFMPIFRKFSADSSQHKKEMQSWKQISLVMMVGCFCCTIYNVYEVLTEGHAHGTTHEVPYMHNRAKPFPWKCSDCDLFDADCWKAHKSH